MIGSLQHNSEIRAKCTRTHLVISGHKPHYLRQKKNKTNIMEGNYYHLLLTFRYSTRIRGRQENLG